MDDATIYLVAALLLAITGTAFAAYERGHHNGRLAEQRQSARTADVVDDLLAASRSRHPGGRDR